MIYHIGNNWKTAGRRGEERDALDSDTLYDKRCDEMGGSLCLMIPKTWSCMHDIWDLGLFLTCFSMGEERKRMRDMREDWEQMGWDRMHLSV